MNKQRSSSFRPEKPLLIWDGECSFCHYWVIKWRIMTGGTIDFKPYDKVIDSITDISKKEFQRASRLIEPDGTVYSGAASAYRALYIGGKWRILHRLYNNSLIFRRLSDTGYHWVAQHRNFLYKVSIRLLGKNPARPKHYWVLYLLALLLLIVFLILAI